jgi:N utilization substance protein B
MRGFIMEQFNKREERVTIIEKLYSYDMNNDFVFLGAHDDYSDMVTGVVNYVCEHKEEIDSKISEAIVNYRLSRLSYVDRAIIRMATAEMMMGLHPRIAINEALEIVKVYTDEGNGSAVKFVNGVLDKVSKNIER